MEREGTPKEKLVIRVGKLVSNNELYNMSSIISSF